MLPLFNSPRVRRANGRSSSDIFDRFILGNRGVLVLLFFVMVFFTAITFFINGDVSQLDNKGDSPWGSVIKNPILDDPLTTKQHDNEESSSYSDNNESDKNDNGNGNNDSEDKVDKDGKEEITDLLAESRQQAVKAGFLHAWNGYVQYAWGADELRPVSRKPHDWLSQGLTIVDSLDTLWIMDLKEEFEEARKWVAKANMIPSRDISVFETIIRSVGGLLSAYQLSGDDIFLEKLIPLADALQYAYNNKFYLPYSTCQLKTGQCRNPSWASGASVLSEIGTIQLEYVTLSKESGNQKYQVKALGVFDHLRGSNPPAPYLYPTFIRPTDGKFTQEGYMTMGALGDSFFEYVLKLSFLYGGENENARKWRDWFDLIIEQISEHVVKYSQPSNLTYFADIRWRNGGMSATHKMDHLACFGGGMYGMASKTEKDPVKAKKYMDIAKGITNTCHESYIRVPTHIGPETMVFNLNDDFNVGVGTYLLRPETVESYFYMWRLTHDQKYRDWGWDFFQALEKHCKVPSGGYSGLRDVRMASPAKDDSMPSYFLAETMKYLYLLFSPDDVISLDDYVFNTEAHPLKIFKD